MFYKNQTILVATRHQKERVIGPALEQALQCKIFTPPDFDTDQFGTFCRQIKRTATAYETVIQKAKTAAQHYGYRYAIANEGSFGPHPDFFMVPGDIELIALIDLKNGIEIIESVISTDTNYAHLDLNAGDDYSAFLKQVKFPSHGLMVKALATGWIQKGITDPLTLKNAIDEALEQSSQVRLETDMRALFNPSRMAVIASAAEKLAQRLLQQCPQCNSPGFGRLTTSGKLLCEWCEAPSTLYQFQLKQCVACDYQEQSKRPDGLTNAPARYCEYCNP